MSDVSSVALRTMGPRAALQGPGDSLENINTNPLPDGASCFVIQNRSNYRLDKLSVAAPAPPTIIAPGLGPGRWIQEGTGSGGGEPLSNTRFADGGTVVPLADQNGAIATPWETAAQLIADVEALPDFRVGYFTPGNYDSGAPINLTVGARYASFSPEYEGIREDVQTPSVILDLNPTADFPLSLTGIELVGTLSFPATEGSFEGELFLEDCNVGGISVGEIHAVNTTFEDADVAGLNFGGGFLKDCFISSDGPTTITISDSSTFTMVGMSFNTNHSFVFTDPGVITVDEVTAAAMAAAGVTVTNAIVTVLELERIQNLYYVDGNTTVPAYLQNGVMGMPFGALTTALTTVLPTQPAPSTFAVASDDYLALHAITANCTIQGITEVVTTTSPVFIWVNLGAVSVSADVLAFLVNIRVLTAVTLAADATVSYSNCSIPGMAAGVGNVNADKSIVTADISAANITFTRCSGSGGADLTATGTVILNDCTFQGNITADTIVIEDTRFTAAVTITATTSFTIDWFSYQSILDNAGTITAPSIVIIGGAPKEIVYWTADDGHVATDFGGLSDFSYNGNGNAANETINSYTRNDSGRLGKLFAKGKNGNVGADQTFQLRKNGADVVGVLVTIANGTSYAEVDASEVTWVTGDVFSIQFDTNIVAPGIIDIGVEFFANGSPTFTP